MSDVRDPLQLLRAAAAAREAAGLRRVLRPRTAGRDGVIDLASNDYLGLARHPAVIEGAAAAVRRWGAGATGSRLVTGSTELHAQLERALADFGGAEAGLVFSSGYLANLAAVTALVSALAAGARQAVGPSAGAPPASTLTAGTPPASTLTAGTPPAGGLASGGLVAGPPRTDGLPGGGLSAGPMPAHILRADGLAGGTLAGGDGRGAGVLVVSDAANHASLVDACRLARARVVVTPHGDAGAVAAALAERTEQAALVVTEGVFSVDGDLAPLAALHRVTREHGGLLVIDEAHALGVLGPGGRGAAADAGLAGQPDVVRTLTLSKSLAAQGGAVLGSAEVIQTLIDTGRSFIFDTGLAPPCAGAALAALGLLAADPELGSRVRASARAIAAEAARLGLAASSPAAGVVSVILGEPDAALAAQRICARHGVRAGCFRPPSVPAGRSCLRMATRATLSERDLATVSWALSAVRDHVPVPVPAGRRPA
ncbi:MAG TPA: aminotransferase class I/II-fold pyridoxal phosphate-dependent enzyme [Streptosporangiaceae bacterium]